MGGTHNLSTVSTAPLEGFKLFYEELTPSKSTSSRMRRVRTVLASK